MSIILQALERPEMRDRLAVAGADCRLSYSELATAVADLAGVLRSSGACRLGLYADNGPAWLVADLAALSAGITLVPLPAFFSRAQLAHIIAAASLDHIILPAGTELGLPAEPLALPVAEQRFDYVRLALPTAACDAKITFTSGTTGQPKGVRLTAATLATVAATLADQLAPLQIRQHLAVLPLATLLENVAGIYVALLSGAGVQLPPLAELGYSGGSGLDPHCFVEAIQRYRPQSLILVPQLLQALVAAAEAGAMLPDSLRFVAVGGGRVAPTLLQRVRRHGVPAYEGYGLSECASVVALNLPGTDRPGSVGRPLPHVRIECAADGEILVHGPRYQGYLGQTEITAGPVATGDLGYLDADGYLHLSGRKKNVFITAFGRNVSPEWVESELTAEPAVLQAAVFGEARPWNVAVIASPASAAAVQAALDRANRRLPDYARIQAWVRAIAPFATSNDQLTANGRLRRPAIWAAYGDAIQALYG